MSAGAENAETFEVVRTALKVVEVLRVQSRGYERMQERRVHVAAKEHTTHAKR